MKKIILGISIAALIVFCGSSQAWAMGKRGGSSGSRSSQSGGSNSGTQANNNSGGNGSQGGQSEDNHQGQGGSNEYSSNSGGGFIPEMNNFNVGNDEGFPAATPVPEPATMSLMGMGLASFLLARKKKQL